MDDNDKPKDFPQTPNLIRLLAASDKVTNARQFLEYLAGAGYGIVTATDVRLSAPDNLALRWVGIDRGDLAMERELVRDWDRRAAKDQTLMCTSKEWQLVDLVTRGVL